MPCDEPTRWQAVRTNDSSYDGQFVYAVRTTRIYCRPSCPSRLPKRANVAFYDVPQAAEAAGYRPCKRCQPHQIGPAARVQQVMAVCATIDAHLDEALTLDDLGERVHASPYHLQRTFKDVMGISPRQYADARRMARFKRALRDEAMRVTDAVYAAGYGASSRLYERLDAQLGMTPTIYQRGGSNMTIHYTTASTPMGRMLIAATERGICRIALGETDEQLIADLCAEFSDADIYAEADRLAGAVEQLSAYFKGWQLHLDLPLDLRVTAFQQRVLQELQRIPYGETRTYADVAAAVGNPKAARAVGQACNRNPVPFVVPCHRVVRSDGRIEGFAYGTEMKRQLLAMEQQAEQQTEMAD